MAGKAGAPIPIGPFGGGLNQLESSYVIGDDQLAVCRNFDIGRSGELTTRVGLKLLRASVAGLGAPTLVSLGIGTSPTGQNFAFVVDTATGFVYYTAGATPGITSNASTWTRVGTVLFTGNSNKVVQYGNTVYFISASSVNQSFSVILNTTSTIGAVALVTGIPVGANAVISKDRLFVFNNDATGLPSSRVYYSATTNPASFPAANFFDINPGDGEGVNAAIVLQDSIIFFKTRSTYVLYFDTDPGLGVLRKISSEIGSSSSSSVVQYENVVYISANKTIYKIQNLLFLDIGRNLNLIATRTRLPDQTDYTKQDWAFVSGTKIVFVIYISPDYAYFTYDVEVDAWVEYVFTELPNRFFTFSDGTDGNNLKQFFATKKASANLYLFSPSDQITLSNFGDYPGNITPATFSTKFYTMTDLGIMKRLFWWGLQGIVNTGVLKLQAFAVATGSTVATITSSSPTSVIFYKGFTPTRGRAFQFVVQANVSTQQKVTVFAGIAHVAGKNAVDSVYTT